MRLRCGGGKLRSDRDAYLLVFDALVFLIILSVASIVPYVLMGDAEDAMETSAYSTLQIGTQATLEVILQATLPSVMVNNTTVQHAQVGMALQIMAQEIENATDEKNRTLLRGQYNELRNEVNALLQRTVPIGNRACLLVKCNNTEIIIGTEPTEAKDTAGAMQKYHGTGVEVVLRQWRG